MKDSMSNGFTHFQYWDNTQKNGQVQFDRVMWGLEEKQNIFIKITISVY